MTPNIIDQQIIARSLHSAAEEMGIDLLRNAFSAIVREAKDMSTALFDATGNVITQGEHVPMLISAMTTSIRACLESVKGRTLTSETVIMTNDAYHGCHHMNDIAFFMPIFVEDEIIAFVGSVAHHMDIGGAAAGMLSSASEIFEEGITIPGIAVELQDGHLPNQVEALLRSNVRVPEEFVGDLNAQITALFTGRTRVLALVEKYGAQHLTEVIQALLDSSEAAMKSVLASTEDFDVRGEAWLDDDGIGGPPLIVKVRILKQADRLSVDFAGSSDQRPCMMNSNYSSTLAGVWGIVRHVFGRDVEMWQNAGSVRPIEVIAPEGSFINCTWPASVHGRTLVCYRVYDAMMKALVQCIPERVMATGFNSSICVGLSRLEDEKFSIFAEVLSGGWGGRPNSDGPSGVPFALSNCSNAPAEYVEAQYPFLRVHRYGLLADSAGDGEYRGGFGEVREYHILADGVFLSLYTDRFKYAPEGILGGQPGTCGRIEVMRGNESFSLPSKVAFELKQGDFLRIIGGGGGGYGEPVRRRPDMRQEDIASGLISIGDARGRA